MRWIHSPKPDSHTVKQLAQQLNVSELIATLLVQRGIYTFEQAKTFFRPTWTDLHDPWLMKDMDKALTRIVKALNNHENILVYGDYDVDGTTSVALVASYLKQLQANITTYIPDRYTEGYGVSFAGIDYAQQHNISLIIALDCGIKAADKVAYASQKNIDFIICDHHIPDNNLPQAVAILNPKQSDCYYPYKELCGCGIGFKLIQGLNRLLNQAEENLEQYTDLVATAIAADIVPITGENRVLATLGLRIINTNPREGIKALLHNRKKQVLSISDIVFFIAPRINAAGRINHGNEAVKLLTEYSLAEAEQLAKELEMYNTERKDLDQQITHEALQQVAQTHLATAYTTVVHSPNWHKGVIGIVASRLIETYHRPTIVFTYANGVWVASARSIKGFDLYAALEACQQHLIQFGGHPFAAGLTVAHDKLNDFKNAFEKLAQQWLTPDQLQPEIQISATLPLNDITPKLSRILKQMEPFGPENMAPVFETFPVFDTGYAQTLGENGQHLKAFIKQNINQQGYPLVGFGLGKFAPQIAQQTPFAIAYTLEENQWNGNITVQLQARDIRLY